MTRTFASSCRSKTGIPFPARSGNDAALSYHPCHTTIVSETEDGKKKVITIKSKAYDIVKASIDTKIGKFTKRRKEILTIMD